MNNHRPRLFLITATACAAAVYAQPVLAQSSFNRLNRNDEKLLRFLQRQPVPGAVEVEPPVKVPELDLTIGVAQERKQGVGSSTASPFSLAYEPAGNRWHVELSSDGISRARADGEKNTGFSDVTTEAGYRVSLDKILAVYGAVSVTWPSRSKVGSDEPSEAVWLDALFEWSAWSAYASVELDRDEASPSPGSSRYTRTGRAKVKYKWSDDWSVAASFRRFLQSGEGAYNKINIEYGFPLPAPKWSGTLSGTLGTTPGRRSTKIEFDVTYGFF